MQGVPGSFDANHFTRDMDFLLFAMQVNYERHAWCPNDIVNMT